MKKFVAGIVASTFVLVLGLSTAAMAGNAANGQSVFDARCTACHNLDDSKKVGPGLHGVTSRQTDEWLSAWIMDPQGTWEQDLPGTNDLKKRQKKEGKKKTAMRYKPLATAEEAADLVAFLHQNDGM